MNHIYKIPIIPIEAEKQETFVQVAEILFHLSKITDDVFNNINMKINSNNSRMSVVLERVANINKKIEKLHGIRKATQVFATCKYPAMDHSTPYVSAFYNAVSPNIEFQKSKFSASTVTEEKNEKLQLYHVKVKKIENKTRVTGLGDIPYDMECVNDLLVHNSGINAYQNVIASNIAETSTSTKQDLITDAPIGTAPQSISERSLAIKSTQLFSYAPHLGDVPVLDVPLDLPDLPNIAGDLRYNHETGPAIAPSFTMADDQLPDLPVIDTDTTMTVETNHIVPNVECLPLQSDLVDTVNPEKIPSVEEFKLPQISDLPPIEEHPMEKKPMPQLDMRASLMEAIRNAGGTKKLKATKKDDLTQASGAQSGGSLFADLHAKLSMRRKGISGMNKDNQMDATTTLERISAMIPPPTTIPNKSTDEDDWDD